MIKTTLSSLLRVGSLVGFLVVVIPAALVVFITPGLHRRRRIASAGARLCLLAAGMPIRVSGLDHLPKDQACVVVANHASYLDGIVLQAALPPTFSFVIKREMENVPFVNFLLMRLGSQYVDRANQHKGGRDALRILKLANSGQALGFFPEGTFRHDAGLRKFHLGAFTTAARNDLPVCPTVIKGTRHNLPADARLPSPGPIEVAVLDQLKPDGSEAEQVRELRTHARDLILEHCGEPDMGHAGSIYT